MPIQGTGSSSRRKTDLAVGANSLASTSSTMRMGSAKKVGLFISPDSGPHANHIITLQASGDGGSTFSNTPHAITGIGSIQDIECICTHVRAKVTTVQGTASTVDISLVIK